jgi:hypothetical protein
MGLQLDREALSSGILHRHDMIGFKRFAAVQSVAILFPISCQQSKRRLNSTRSESVLHLKLKAPIILRPRQQQWGRKVNARLPSKKSCWSGQRAFKAQVRFWK